MCACVRACVRACVPACVRVCVCVLFVCACVWEGCSISSDSKRLLKAETPLDGDFSDAIVAKRGSLVEHFHTSFLAVGGGWKLAEFTLVVGVGSR